MQENQAILLENNYETTYEGYDPSSPESQIIFEFMQNEHQKESLNMATLVQKQLTEILYIFFGIHTANVVQLADRMEQRAQLAAA